MTPNSIIAGSACEFRTSRHLIQIVDPLGKVLGEIAFTNGDTAQRFASAAGICASVTFDHEGLYDWAASEGANQ